MPTKSYFIEQKDLNFEWSKKHYKQELKVIQCNSEREDTETHMKGNAIFQ